MAVTEISIASNALLMLGAEAISSYLEGERGRAMGALVGQMRDATLRAHPWSCATLHIILDTPLTETPVGWSYAFQKPSDWLRTNYCGRVETEPQRYEMQGARILTDDNPLYLNYVYRLEDPNAWDALLTDAICARLSQTVAYPITKSASMVDMMTKLYEIKLKEARTVNGIENPPKRIVSSPIRESRQL